VCRQLRDGGSLVKAVNPNVMPRVMIGPAPLELAEMSRLRACAISTSGSFGLVGTAPFGGGPSHLPRHLLYRVPAYRLQAEHLGDLDSGSPQIDRYGSPDKAGIAPLDLSRSATSLRPGTILRREWNGQAQSP
jgi:hypothetical protein